MDPPDANTGIHPAARPAVFDPGEAIHLTSDWAMTLCGLPIPRGAYQPSTVDRDRLCARCRQRQIDADLAITTGYR